MIDLSSENLAWVYDEIYQGFINYTAEYQFYEQICKTYNATKILELGYGTENLARSFLKNSIHMSIWIIVFPCKPWQGKNFPLDYSYMLI